MSVIHNPEWLTYDREQMFRRVWLPLIAPNQQFTTTSLPLLQDLYPGVFDYGPYWSDWLAWREAVSDFAWVNNPANLRASVTIDFLHTLVNYYGNDSEISNILHGLPAPEGEDQYSRYFDDRFVDAQWLVGTWGISQEPTFGPWVFDLYDRGFGEVGLDDLQRALTNAGAIILLRFLPTDERSEEGRKRALAAHNLIAEMYDLPQLPEA